MSKKEEEKELKIPQEILTENSSVNNQGSNSSIKNKFIFKCF